MPSIIINDNVLFMTNKGKTSLIHVCHLVYKASKILESSKKNRNFKCLMISWFLSNKF